MKAHSRRPIPTQDTDLITRVLQLLGVTGAPSLEEFDQACRLIREVAAELKEEFDLRPKQTKH